jgi:hypothetical protein
MRSGCGNGEKLKVFSVELVVDSGITGDQNQIWR